MSNCRHAVQEAINPSFHSPQVKTQTGVGVNTEDLESIQYQREMVCVLFRLKIQFQL